MTEKGEKNRVDGQTVGEKTGCGGKVVAQPYIPPTDRKADVKPHIGHAQPEKKVTEPEKPPPHRV